MRSDSSKDKMPQIRIRDEVCVRMSNEEENEQECVGGKCEDEAGRKNEEEGESWEGWGEI